MNTGNNNLLICANEIFSEVTLLPHREVLYF